MTIDGLNPLTTLTAGDELPVWDVEASAEEPTKKITAQNMAASVKSLASLPNTTEMNSAIAQGAAPVSIGDMITNRSPWLDYQSGKKSGNLVIISFFVKKDTPNGTTLFRIDNSILPEQNIYIAPLIYSSGQLNTSGSVWIEYNKPYQVTYYGATAPAGSYATLIYMAE